jgi:hypothetical protein
MYLRLLTASKTYLPVNHHQPPNSLCENHNVLPMFMGVSNVRPLGLTNSSQHVAWGNSECTCASVLSLGGQHDHSSHILAVAAEHLYIETFQQPRPLATELENHYKLPGVPWSFSLRPQVASKGPRPVQIFGSNSVSQQSSISWITLHIQLSWSTHIFQVGKKAAQRLSALDPVLNKSGLSVRKSVMCRQQPLRPVME